MTDFKAMDASGADMSIEWTDDGGARITVSGDQPLDQPGCSIKRSREEMAALRDHLDDELGDGWQPIETAPKDKPIDLWLAFPKSGETKRETDCEWDQTAGWVDDWDDPVEWGPDEYGKTCVVTHWRPPPAPPRTPAKGG